MSKANSLIADVHWFLTTNSLFADGLDELLRRFVLLTNCSTLLLGILVGIDPRPPKSMILPVVGATGLLPIIGGCKSGNEIIRFA